MRLDLELVKRNLFETRNKAQYAITNESVLVNNKIITKSSYSVNDDDIIEIKNEVLPYVSKGGLKLEKALKSFEIKLDGKTMIDIGSSTGGFSDCAIKNNVDKIIAIDVGSDQFSEKVLNTGKVDLYENTDFRAIDFDIIKNATIATIDVSFISVKMLLNKINNTNLKEIILLIKPQFECGLDIAHKYKGVILDKQVHNDVINIVIKEFNKINFGLVNLDYSPIRGGNGNIEYLAYLKKDTKNNVINYQKIVKEAFKNL